MGHDVGRDTRVERILSPGTYLLTYVRPYIHGQRWMDGSIPARTHTTHTRTQPRSLASSMVCPRLLSVIHFVATERERRGGHRRNRPVVPPWLHGVARLD